MAEIPSARKPILSDSASATMPRMTGRRSSRWRFVHDTSGSETTSISPFAPSFESGPPAASCSAEGLRTATAQVETPRIITPSRTAWPPIGASFVASRAGRGAAPLVDGEALTLSIVSARAALVREPAQRSVRSWQASWCALSSSEVSAIRPSGSAVASTKLSHSGARMLTTLELFG